MGSRRRAAKLSATLLLCSSGHGVTGAATSSVFFTSSSSVLGFLRAARLGSGIVSISSSTSSSNNRRLHSATRLMSTDAKHELVIDDFCLRQFSPEYGGNRIEMSPSEFEAKVNAFYKEHPTLHGGYAPFCKHVFMPNFAGLPSGTVAITPENEHLLRSTYEARTEKELPVLIRFFPKELVPPPPAAYLDIILYSREQIRKENAAQGNTDHPEHAHAPWGIISVKAQDVDHELPMQPITMLRNALGREYGGSGVPLEQDKYKESVAFWSQNAIIR